MTKEKIKELMSKRDDIDEQISCLHEVLKANNVDMNSPLVDGEGFPIADLDIFSIRKARQSIICLMNDRKNLMVEIEELMMELHANVKSGVEQVESDGEQVVHRTSNRPFLEVENVLPGSPAFHGGLLSNDLIIQLGPLHPDNFHGLQNLSEIINEHVGKKLNITVLRDTTVHRLIVIPGRWDGVGVFGARFTIIKD